MNKPKAKAKPNLDDISIPRKVDRKNEKRQSIPSLLGGDDIPHGERKQIPRRRPLKVQQEAKE